jgi:hypothetical protein
MDPIETGWGGLDWIDLPQDRYKWRALVNTVMKFRVLRNAGKLSSGCSNSCSSGHMRNAPFDRVT